MRGKIDASRYRKQSVISEHKNKPRLSIYHIALLLFGICCLLITNIEFIKAHEWLKSLLTATGQALIVGAIISHIIELPSMVSFFRSRIIDLFISDAYVDELSDSDLLQLRDTCTRKIHLKDSMHFEEGLIKLDSEICALLQKPYYEYFKKDITCIIEKNYVKKRYYVNYKLVNPLKDTASYRHSSSILGNSIEGVDLQQHRILKKCTVKIDSQEAKDITKEILISVEEINRIGSYADYKSQLMWKNSENEGLDFIFLDELEMELIYENLVPTSDIIYTDRIRVPTKYYSLDYKFPNEDYRLVGSMFGTLASPITNNMKILKGEGSLSFNSYEWLLPGNGVYLAAIPLKQLLLDEVRKENGIKLNINTNSFPSTL